ncbi:MAG TPA: glycosyltransferase family 9 protein [Tepidisphaeraceae bacterium]|jgi:hypothetical protein|nr:glycosyltransferase family 9 protein [Tepidisphaeraceae bacterium]
MVFRRNILIFHQAALGDFIVTWPLALALARLHPQSRVFYVTHGEKGALSEKALRIEALDVDSGGWHRLFDGAGDLPAQAAKTLAGAHTVLSFMASPNDQWCQNVQAANPEANLLTISTTPPDDFAGHQTDFLVDQLRPWPAIESAARQILRSISERGVGQGTSSPDGAVVIHPGGGADRKCWPADRYLALAERLRDAGKNVRVLLGEVEIERWPAERIDRFKAVSDVRTPRNLVELMSHIASASVFVGNDSGPGHLAGILGVGVMSLFGQTSNAARWKPLGPRVEVLQRALEDLTLPEVEGRVNKILLSSAANSKKPQAVADDQD